MDPVAEAVCTVVVVIGAVAVGWAIAALQCYGSMLGRGDDTIAQTVSIEIAALQCTAGIMIFSSGYTSASCNRYRINRDRKALGNTL